MNLRDIPIRRKLNWLVGVSSALALCVASTVFVVRDVVSIRHTTTATLQSVAEVVSHNSIAALIFNDAEAARETLSSLARQPNVVRACIYDDEGEVFASYRNRGLVPTRPGAEDTFPPLSSLNRAPQRGLLSITTRIEDGDQVYGTLYIEAGTQQLHARMTTYAATAVSVLLVSLTVAILLSTRLQQAVSVPIVQLAAAAARVSVVGDYAIRVEKRANDEIGQLYDSFNEMLARIAERDNQLRSYQQYLEQRVEHRTRELQTANDKLNAEIEQRREAQAELERAQQELVTTARQAGMAEIASGVLHNVGNVLNSVNVAANLIMNAARSSHVQGLAKAVELLDQHEGRLSEFFAAGGRGEHLPAFLRQLSRQLTAEREHVLAEAVALASNVEHIKEIVAMQQSYARVAGARDKLRLATIADEAIRLNDTRLARHEVDLVRQYQELPEVVSDKHRIVQILVNLINNAIHATIGGPGPERRVTVRIAREDDSFVIEIEDNGVGIPAENLARVFQHGFTTRRDGHGFGLHSSALAARELGGSLTAHSAGPNQGATFRLTLPADAGVRRPDAEPPGTPALPASAPPTCAADALPGA